MTGRTTVALALVLAMGAPLVATGPSGACPWLSVPSSCCCPPSGSPVGSGAGGCCEVKPAPPPAPTSLAPVRLALPDGSSPMLFPADMDGGPAPIVHSAAAHLEADAARVDSGPPGLFLRHCALLI